jgi:hypothetical protein
MIVTLGLRERSTENRAEGYERAEQELNEPHAPSYLIQRIEPRAALLAFVLRTIRRKS